MTHRFPRRRFLQTTAAGLGYFLVADAKSAARAAANPSEKLRIAGIGVGGKGSSDIDQAAGLGQVVALCDIDENHLRPKASKWSDARTFHDYRRLFDAMMKEIDAIVVSTPDHTHAHPSILAMREKKHVYCQKPLTHSVWEARQMREVAKRYGVCTQMGNQGTAENGLRRAVELVQAGLFGGITEVHVWTNRPVWPQAPQVKQRPPEAPVPAHIHWDEFIGPAPFRPFAEYVNDDGKGRQSRRGAYHPFNWRGWWDFGTGALGDMACHTANMAFMALKLGAPTGVVAETVVDLNDETFPAGAKVVYQFPARNGMPPCQLTWYEGRQDGKLIHPPQELLQKLLKPGEKLSGSGSILVGDKGVLFSPNDYGASYRIIGEGLEEAAKAVDESLPRNGRGDSGMKEEWAKAIREGRPEIALSNFDYAGTLTEAILLGNIAIKVGKPLEWDAASLQFRNSDAANAMVRREYRSGWEI